MGSEPTPEHNVEFRHERTTSVQGMAVSRSGLECACPRYQTSHFAVCTAKWAASQHQNSRPNFAVHTVKQAASQHQN